MSIIIHGDHELEVGKIYMDKETSDDNNVFHRVAFRVIRVATEQEYIDYVLSQIPNYKFSRNGKYYYEVQMD